MIEVSHLTKKYGDHYAVNDLSFQMEKGKIYGFLGPNGAGKSTTMNIMTGYIASTSGEVRIDGYDVLAEPEKAKARIGYLPEIPPLYVDMTVREYLVTVAELKKLKHQEIPSEVDRVMNLVGITSMRNRLIKNLSKGYKQRVGIAQALIGSPEIIILDEPTVGLDPKQILEIRELIRSLREKHTVILSSHILSEISAVCDDILIINKGSLVVCGTSEDVEQMLKGKNTMHLLLEAERTAAERAAAQIPSVNYWQITEQADHTLLLTLTIEGDEDVRRKVFLSMVKNQCVILEMKKDTMSLEDIFLELTKEEQK